MLITRCTLACVTKPRAMALTYPHCVQHVHTCRHALKFELIIEVDNELVCISSGIYKLGCVD